MGTLYINLFGGPGVSKSSTAALLFARLKFSGENAELITEYAKDKTWEEDHDDPEDIQISPAKLCQPYTTGKQLFRQFRVKGKVDYAITDSPLLTGIFYGGFGTGLNWELSVVEQFNLFTNLNILLVRSPQDHKYNPKGRTQTEEEAKEIDKKAENLLKNYNIPYHKVVVYKDGIHVEEILELIKKF